LSYEKEDIKKRLAKLRILWHSVAPWIASGHGKATREICTRLPKYGYEVLISAYYGVEPGGIPPYTVPVFPSKEGSFGIAPLSFAFSFCCRVLKLDNLTINGCSCHNDSLH
jgi:hypothetical protein